MAESDDLESSLPTVAEEALSPSSDSLLSLSDLSDDEDSTDVLNRTPRPASVLESHSKELDDDEEEAPYPRFDIWSMPNARVPIESYKEMTLACRFVPTDQWLTTRVDKTWTVSQVKHHMLTKIWGGRRYQLSLPRILTNSGSKTAAEGGARSPGDGQGGGGGDIPQGRLSISSSNYSSVVFAASAAGDYERSHYTLDTVINASAASLGQSVVPTVPDTTGALGSAPRLTRSHSSSDLRSRARSVSSSPSSQRRPRGQSISGSHRPPSNRSDHSMIRDLRRDEAIDRLYERMEAAVKRKVLKAGRNYRVVSFSNGIVMDDKDPLSTYGIKPFELLEIQPVTQCVRISRPMYLEPYFETDAMVRVRAGSEKHGVAFLRRLRKIQQEEAAKTELAKAMSSLGLDDEQNRPGSEWGTGLSAVTRQRNLEERREEERRRILLEQARKEEHRKQKRERKEQEAEKWKFRKMIVEGHDLNLWRDHLHDAFPEQSWDLRRVVDVQIPRPQKPVQTTISPGQAGYAALALSGNLQSVSTRAPDKEKAAKAAAKDSLLDQPTLHIRFSIPLASVHASLNPAAAAALHAARLKRAAKANPGSTYLAESLASLGAASTRRLDTTDPYNQGIGFGTSTLEGAGTASLVLRLPNERTREHFCRIIHRSAGKYPLISKHRRKLAFEPVADLVPLPDPDPERTRPHGAAFPEWRARVLKKAIASGRSGFLSSSAWGAEFNEATGLYLRPTPMVDVKGKGPALPEGEEGYDGDDDDDASLASDTEWEGWRRELEMDMPLKHLPTIPSGTGSTATPRPGQSITTITEGAKVSFGQAITIPSADTPQRTPSHRHARRHSLQMSKKLVVDGIAGKGLLMPRTNAYASWTSFSSNSSVNSSFFSHEEYRAGEGSDTTPNRRPPLAPLVTSGSRGIGAGHQSGSLSRAKSAATFSSKQHVVVPAVSASAPLSATIDRREALASYATDEPALRKQASFPSEPADDEMFDELPDIDPSVVLPGLGGGLGNPALFPPYADLGTTVTTVTSGRKLGNKKSGSGWLSKSFVKATDREESAENGGTTSTSVFGSLSRKSSNSNVGGVVRSISKRDR